LGLLCCLFFILFYLFLVRVVASPALPATVPCSQTNRQCASGLDAVLQVANAIRSGMLDVGIGAGVEVMSLAARTAKPKQKQEQKGGGGGGGSGGGGGGGIPGADAMASLLNPRVLASADARACLIPMGITSENVAERFGVTRERQDAFAVESHRRAAAAAAAGLFRDELVPVWAPPPPPPSPSPPPLPQANRDDSAAVLVEADDGIRAAATAEALAKLRPAFKPGGSTTAGNASQVSDGAAAVVLASGRAARGVPGARPLGRVVGHAVVGVPPEIMGIGPAVAIPAALERCGLRVGDIGVFELNEAFASQAVYCIERLGLDPAKVNPLGGAIALGHPLGCTGARQVATLLHHMRREGLRYGCVSMCMGTGMGMAAVFENLEAREAAESRKLRTARL
jgi:acetyl-CoA acyltransferase 1